MAEWWIPGWVLWRREVRGWQQVALEREEAELRVYVGLVYTTAVVRLRRWSKVIFCDIATTSRLAALTEGEWEQAMTAFLRRANASRPGGGGSPPPDDPKTAKAFPAVWEYLTSTAWPDGSTRKPSTISIFVEDSQVKVCLNEKNDSASCYATGKTLERALAALEGLLTSEEPPWRAWRQDEASVSVKGRKRS